MAPTGESDNAAMPFETVLAAVQAPAEGPSRALTDKGATTQRQSVLSTFELGLRKSKASTAACEQELQQSVDHSQASINASLQLAGAQASSAPTAPAGAQAEDAHPQEQNQAGRNSRPGASGTPGAPQLPVSSAPDGSSHAATAAVQVHDGGSQRPSQPTSAAPAAATLRAAAGSTQVVGSTGGVPHASEAGGLQSAVSAASNTQGSGATTPGNGGVQGAGVVARGAAQLPQARSKPFASLMQAARPQAPEATMLIRTSKALAQALRSGGDLKLDLSPEQLGRIQVRMTGTEGGMEIVLACHEPRAAEAMERTLPQLRRSLEEQGIHAASMRVCMAEGAGGAAQPAASDGPRPGAAESAAFTPFEGDAGAQGRHASAHDRPERAFPLRSSEDGELWEVPSHLGTVIASVPVVGMSCAVDVTV